MASDRTTNIAAIDAGSNAIRLVIARAKAPNSYQELKNDRVALRLGHDAFTQRQFDSHTIDQAAEVFRRFRSRMNQYNVQRYRAVATSAARDARNRKVLVDRVYRTSGIRLEVIDGPEEARLTRSAVLSKLSGNISPRWIADLGGGSLQLSILCHDVLEDTVSLSVGTVRLMEKFEIRGALSERQLRLIKERTLTLFRRFLPSSLSGTETPAAWCGGNAEALALIAPGTPLNAIPRLDIDLLARKVRRIARMDVWERMSTFRVRKDRAEVMAIAAVVFLTLGRWAGIKTALISGVGVKEGVLRDVLLSLSGRDAGVIRGNEIVAAARRFAARLSYDAPHCEAVREFAITLFDQLRPQHGLKEESRSLLEMGALLHDIGHSVRRESHHKIGEYLVRNGNIPGLGGVQRDIVSCLVRYHSESAPSTDHKVYASLSPPRQRQVRRLVSLLQIADRLDSDHRQSVAGVRTRLGAGKLILHLKMRRPSDLILWNVEHGAPILQQEFGLTVQPKAVV